MPYPLTAPADNPYGPLITFQTEGVLPPAAYYISPNEGLQVVISSPIGAFQIALDMRFLRPQGNVINEHYDYVVYPTSGADFIASIPPNEGWLISATFSAPAPWRGQVYARLLVATAPGQNTSLPTQVLIAGYVSQLRPLSYPSSPQEDNLSGFGYPQSVAVGSFGTAQLAIIQPALRTTWLLRVMRATLSCTVAAANRTVRWAAADSGGRSKGFSLFSPLIPAAGTFQFCWYPRANEGNYGGFYTSSIPGELLFLENDTLLAQNLNGDPSDQWTNVTATVEAFCNG